MSTNPKGVTAGELLYSGELANEQAPAWPGSGWYVITRDGAVWFRTGERRWTAVEDRYRTDAILGALARLSDAIRTCNSGQERAG